MENSLIDVISNEPVEKRDSVFKALLSRKARGMKWPCSAHFELTPLCTLNCKMCYVHLDENEVGKYGRILTGNEWIDISKQCIDRGVLYFTLTGGEALVHPEFKEIYNAIYDRGGLISLISNGTCFSDDIISFLKEKPPQNIFITVYGCSRDTYQRLCDNASAYSTVMNAIDRLIENSLNVKLQVTVTEDNMYDLPEIVKYAKEKGLMIAYNTDLHVEGLCTEEVLKKNQVSRKKIEEIIEQMKNDSLIPEEKEYAISGTRIHPKGMQCGAGNDSFGITWRGTMRPCVLMAFIERDVIVNGIDKCWEEISKTVDEIPQLVKCQTCDERAKCNPCVGMHYGDTGEFGKPSPRLCYKIQHGIMN